MNEQEVIEKLEKLVFQLSAEEIEDSLLNCNKDYVGTLVLGNGEKVGCALDANYFDGDGCIEFRFSQGMGSHSKFKSDVQKVYDYFGHKTFKDVLPPYFQVSTGEDYHGFPRVYIKTKHRVKIKVV